MKVLIVAPNASSRFGGEAFLPLKYFEILRRRGHPVQLIAHSRNRANLLEAFPADQEVIHYIEDSRAHRLIWSVGRRFPDPLRGAIFGTALNLLNEMFQARLIRRLVKAGDVDVIHQPIPVSPKLPSSLHGFGVPVVIGPMNGGMRYPEGYEDYQSNLARRFIDASRKLAVALNVLIPGKRKAAVLLVANARTRDALPVRHPRVVELVENGVDLSVWDTADGMMAQRSAQDPFRLVFMGRLVDWKAINITLDAVWQARKMGWDVRLDILGDGEERAALEAQAKSLNLQEVIRFHGFQPQDACAVHLRQADALILNSIYECGGAVVLEAMSVGLPVIASDWGGPADYVDATCGLLISPVPRADFASRLAAAIVTLAKDPAVARQMGEAGRKRVAAEFDWEKKVDRVIDLYDSLV